MHFTPLSDNVLVKSLNESDQDSVGIYIPMGKSDPSVVEGVVISIGPGRLSLSGHFLQSKLKTCDKVWFVESNATKIEVDGKSAFVVSEQHILGYQEL